MHRPVSASLAKPKARPPSQSVSHPVAVTFLTAAEEAVAGTGPTLLDTDGDDYSAGMKVNYGGDPLDDSVWPGQNAFPASAPAPRSFSRLSSWP